MPTVPEVPLPLLRGHMYNTTTTTRVSVCAFRGPVKTTRHRPHTVREPQVREMSRLKCVLGPVVADHQKGIMQFQWPAGRPAARSKRVATRRARAKQVVKTPQELRGRKASAAEKGLSERGGKK